MTSDPAAHAGPEAATAGGAPGAAQGEAPGEAPGARAKRAAAWHAAELVEEGMRVGLGTGSTAAHLIARLGERARGGLRFTGVATSEETARLAREAGLEMATLDEVEWLDLTIDGADEFDANLNLIKGGGGALLREKIVATASDRMVVIADAGKEVARLGAFPLPVEVVPFGWRASRSLLEEAVGGLGLAGGARPELRRRGDDPFVTDGGHYLLDLPLGRIDNPWQTSLVINQIPGVVENGLFVDVCDAVVIGRGDGGAELREVGAGSRREPDGSAVENAFTRL